MTLEGKNILVTGGSRGIGGACTKSLVEQGAKVVVHYRSGQTAARALQEKLGEDKCFLLAMDLENPETPDRLWQEAKALVGPLHVLINNAAVFQTTPVGDDLEQWRQNWQSTLQINLLAPAELCRAAIRDFQAQGGGKIINISSRAAFRGEAPDQMPYGASKGALITLTKTIARGFAKDGVLAYAIAPGFTGTEMVWDNLNEDRIAQVTSEIPLGEIAPPKEVAALATFLCGDNTRHLTGATFDLNGASYVR